MTWPLSARSVVVVQLALAAVVSLAVVGCGQAPKSTGTTVGAGTPQPPPRLEFGYDRSSPLGFSNRGVIARIGTIQVDDVAYTSGGLKVEGYLVEPAGRARHPAVILVHGSGGDRRELLGDAVALARMGAVALTITEPSTSAPLPAPTTYSMLLSESRLGTVRDVVAVRRAADVLASLPTVDSSRLGYLGWSAGAKTGTFVAASDPRFRALALLSGGAAKLSAFVGAAPARSGPRCGASSV
jgi:dipeptidyl aminopeptidase/acylaminoacyl peptidase